MILKTSASIRKRFTGYDIGKGGGLLILLIVTILPFFILSFYNHPSLDDFAFIDVELQKGFWGAQQYWYLTWTGRYFSTALLSLSPLIFNAYWGYKLNAAILLLLLLFATYWLSGKVFNNLDKNSKIGITSLFIFSYLFLLPKVSTGFYWQTTSYQYVTACTLTFFLLGSIISYYQSANKKSYFIFSCVLAIAIIGCHEISMVYIDLFILVITLFTLLKRRELLFPLTLLSLCIIFSLIEVFAPGNTKRNVLMYHDSHILKYSVRQSFLFGIDLIIQWVPFMFFIGFLLFNLLSKRVDWRVIAKSFFVIPLWFSFMACMCIPVIGLFIVYWSMGWIPTRVLDLIYFYFIVGMMYFLICSIAHIKIRYPLFEIPVFIKTGMMVAFIAITCFYKNGYKANNITVAYSDLISGIASAYNKERVEENEYLKNFKGDSCTINSIKNFPQSLFIINLPQPAEPGDSLGKLINYSFYQYYHKKYIGIK
jgi:hypothetical protein